MADSPLSVPRASKRPTAFRLLLWGLVATLYFGSPFLLGVLGWFQEPFTDLGGADRVSHRVHEILFGVTFAQAMAGAVSQLRRPKEWSAGMMQTLVAIAAFVGMLAAVGRAEWLGVLFLSLAVGAAALHPAGEELWHGRWRPSLLLLGLAVAGVLPWVSVAEENLIKAQVEAADHLTHWGGVAAFAVVQLLLGFLAALRPPGFRLVAASVGVAGLTYFGASLLFPFDASAKPQFFAVWLLLWSFGWMAIAFLSDEKVRQAVPIVGVTVVAMVLAAGGVVTLIVALALVAVLVSIVRRRGWPRWIRGGLAGLGFIVLIASGAIAVDSGDASNIPHGLVVEYTAANRLTCLECHATGLKGATVIPHEVGRICADEFCWDGRNDCMGCHRYDPSLIPAASLAAPEISTGLTDGGARLLLEQLAALRRYGR